MKVHELVEWLATQDQNAKVKVVEHSSGTGYYDQGGNVRVVAFNPVEHAEDYYGDGSSLLLGAINT